LKTVLKREQSLFAVIGLKYPTFLELVNPIHNPTVLFPMWELVDVKNIIILLLLFEI
jgi:hypothetical protein